MARKVVVFVVVALLGSCACDPDRVPGDYDRPAIVRGAARAGAYVGAVPGLLATAVFWPFQKALNLAVDEPLGYSAREWTLLPLTAFASAGHYLLGGPPAALHWLFYGAWVARPDPVGFDHTPPATAVKRDD